MEFQESDDLTNHPAFDRVCTKCDKFITCFLFRDFAQVTIQNMGQKDPKQYPIDPYNLAKICTQYHPKRSNE